MTDDLRQRYAEAIARWALMYPIPAWKLAGGDAAESLAKAWGEVAVPFVTDVRDEEMAALRERVAELEATPVDWNAQRRRADIAEAERNVFMDALIRLHAVVEDIDQPNAAIAIVMRDTLALLGEHGLLDREVDHG